MSVDVRVPPPSVFQERSVGVDLVRVVGVVAIVAGHTWNEAWAREWLFSWHVPVFFVITGYLWRPGRTVRAEASRRARTLLIPYFGWLVIVAVAWYGWLAASGHALAAQTLVDLGLGGAHIQRPFSAFWFITALFVAAVLMRWLQTVSPLLPWFVGACGLVWCTFDPEAARAVPWSAVIGVAAMPFIGVGQLLRTHRQRIERPAAFGLALLIPAGVLIVATDLSPLDLKAGDLGTPLLSIALAAAVSAGLILTAEAVALRLPTLVGRAVNAVAAVSLAIVLGHALVLGIAGAIGLAPSKWVFLAAYSVPLAIGLLLRRTPLARWLL